MASRRPRSRNPTARTDGGSRSRRGSVTVTLRLPRYVIAKPLASGKVAFYFNVPTRYRVLGCSIPNEPLGTDYSTACGSDGNGGRAAAGARARGNQEAPRSSPRALPEKNDSDGIPLQARIGFKNRTGRQASMRWGSRIQR